MAKVLNKTRNKVEPATQVICPRCCGFGMITGIVHKCPLCASHGYVWRSDVNSGWFRQLYARLHNSIHYQR